MYSISQYPLRVKTDYPRNWNEFLDWFASEGACLAYLEKLRWPGGFVCPACGVVGEPYRSSRVRLMCCSCAHQGSVTAGMARAAIELAMVKPDAVAAVQLLRHGPEWAANEP